MKIKIEDNKVIPGEQEVNSELISNLAESMATVGLLNPISVDQNNVLIAGWHRLQTAKKLDWTEIACTVTDISGLQITLARLDENIVRSRLTGQKLSELFLRRKKLYETIYPETKQGMRNG